MKRLTDEQVVHSCHNYKVYDNFDWAFCADIVYDDFGVRLTPVGVKRKFKNYYKKIYGVAPYDKCPKCGSQLILYWDGGREAVRCCLYPNCKFIATYLMPFRRP